MKLRSVPFERLPFSELYRSYIRQPGKLSSFYPDHPFDEESVRRRAGEFRFRGDREESVRALREFNLRFDAPEITLRQIDRLADPDALAVVTGQQLTLYGGPLFTIYKTITTIIYARRWEDLLGRPVIPVFWMADEDHDFREAAEVGLLHNERWMMLGLESESSGPAGRAVLGEEFEKLDRELFELLPESDFTTGLREELGRFYRKGATIREAFAGWMLHLFARHGLILAGSDDPQIKRLTFEPMLMAASRHEELFRSLEKQSLQLEEEGFGRQALVQDSNLFYLDPETGRRKLVLQDDRWSTGNGRSWSGEELADAIRTDPDLFSPNVFLRPLLQDRLLPVLAYVPGPGELAYYAQMNLAYELAGQQMPLMLPRFSVTLKEPAIDRTAAKLPFQFHEYCARIEDLESLFVERIRPGELEDLFEAWKERTREISGEYRERVRQIDPTLEAAADKVQTGLENELEKLRKKCARSIKQQEKIQMDRIGRVRENLFPDGQLQERQIAFIFYMNKYGPDLWDRLIDLLSEEVPDSHKLICL